MRLTMLEAMGAKRLSGEQLLRLCDEKTSWSTSASGPGGHTVRVTSKRGATPQEIANDIAVAASRLASREQREGLGRKRTLQSADDAHKASSSGTLTAYGVSERMSVCLGFAEAFGASDDCAPAIEANIMKDCVPHEVKPASGLSSKIAEQRKAIALAMCFTKEAFDTVEETDWSNEQQGDDVIAVLKSEYEHQKAAHRTTV